jgi:hypothetical protein
MKLEKSECDKITLFLVATIGPGGKYLTDIREKSDAPILVLDYAPPDGFKPPAEVGIFTNRTNFRSALRGLLEWFGEDVCLVTDESRKCEELAARHIREAWQDVALQHVRKEDYVLRGSSDRVINMLDSLHELRKYPPINLAVDKFKNRVGVVVGAGPSLDRNIHLLKEHRDKLVIAAVNSSLPALDKIGVVPDFVVICEAKEVGKTIEKSTSLPQTVYLGNGRVRSLVFHRLPLVVRLAALRQAYYIYWALEPSFLLVMTVLRLMGTCILEMRLSLVQKLISIKRALAVLLRVIANFPLRIMGGKIGKFMRH